jgi:predicted glycosyltransferase
MGARAVRVLFDVTHPALVHLFETPARTLADRGHDVAVAAREKDVTTDLLDAAGIPYAVASRAGTGPLSRVVELAVRELGLLRIARRFRPDVVVSQVDPAAVHVARLVGASSVVFDDSEHERFAASVTHPFADVVCTPAKFRRDVPNQRRYDGFHELAYLHPERFTPDPDVLREHGVEPDEPFAVVRFVSWEAHHDVGQDGFSPAGKHRLLAELSEHAAVYVSSERDVPADVDADPLPVPSECVHDLLSFADCYVGDSQTMATEAAVLGTPAVRSNSFAGDDDMSNFRELENEYGLLESFEDEDAAIERAVEFVREPPDETLSRRRERLLTDKIDVASFVVDVVEGVA